MAVLIEWAIAAAALHIGDPGRQRVQGPQWNNIATMSLSDICAKYMILKYEDSCALPADGLLTWPDELVALQEIKVSLTPSVESSFYKLDEKFKDEWDAFTLRGVPAAEAPVIYFADTDFIRLGATSTADLEDGCRLSYFGVPPEVVDPTTTYMPLPDEMRSYFVQRMIVYALFADERDDLAREQEALWNAREDEIRKIIDKRTVDRREALRPRSWERKYRGMA